MEAKNQSEKHELMMLHHCTHKRRQAQDPHTTDRQLDSLFSSDFQS